MADPTPHNPSATTAGVAGDNLENDNEIDAAIAPSAEQGNTQSSGTATGTDTGMNYDGSAPTGSGGSGGGAPGAAPGADGEGADGFEPRISQKKDATLREFLGKMDDYAPIIPDAVTNYYLTLAGLPPPPHTSPHLARLLALATQKFIADIAADAYQYARIRSSNTTSNNPMGGLGAVASFGTAAGPGGAAAGGAGGDAKGAAAGGGKGPNLGVQRSGFGGGGQGGGQGRTVLTMEDLGMAVGEYGVNVRRGEFYR